MTGHKTGRQSQTKGSRQHEQRHRRAHEERGYEKLCRDVRGRAGHGPSDHAEQMPGACHGAHRQPGGDSAAQREDERRSAEGAGDRCDQNDSDHRDQKRPAGPEECQRHDHGDVRKTYPHAGYGHRRQQHCFCVSETDSDGDQDCGQSQRGRLGISVRSHRDHLQPALRVWPSPRWVRRLWAHRGATDRSARTHGPGMWR